LEDRILEAIIIFIIWKLYLISLFTSDIIFRSHNIDLKGKFGCSAGGFLYFANFGNQLEADFSSELIVQDFIAPIISSIHSLISLGERSIRDNPNLEYCFRKALYHTPIPISILSSELLSQLYFCAIQLYAEPTHEQQNHEAEQQSYTYSTNFTNFW
jgi:hypothetical protein